MPATRTAANRRVGRSQPITAPSPQAALIADPHQQSRPTQHNGVRVLREEPVMSLPNAPFRFTRLVLDDGGTAFACRDCVTTADTRGQIMVHRNETHGAQVGKGTPRLIHPGRSKKEAPDLVAAPREDGSPVPQDPMMMRLGELLALMPSIAALGDLVERTERERDEALAEADAHRIDRADRHKIDVYDHNRQEILDLRLQVQKQANYNEVKEELYALRAWKKKVEAKLKAVGFVLTEEE